MKIRPACSGLDIGEAMEKVKEVHSMNELKKELNRGCPGYYNEDTITFKDYGYDERIGWHTWLICADAGDGSFEQCAVFFADSNIF